MRIGINARFLAAPVSGVQRFAHEVGVRLLRNGDAVVFVPGGVNLAAPWKEAGVVAGRLRGHAWEQLELPASARARCDVLFNPCNTAPLHGPRHVLMLHDVFPLIRPQWYSQPFAAWYRMVVPAAARSAAIVLTTSSCSARLIAETLDVDAARIVVVPQGLEPFDRPAPRADVLRVLDEYGLRMPYVLVAGAGDPRKNTAFAETVVQEYAARFGSAPVLVAVGAASRRVHGRPPPRGTRTKWVGRVDDARLRALYTGATAVLSPSRDEGFGRVPLEAMSCGTPCIVADYGAADEVLGGTPARRPPLDVATWTDSLRDIVLSGERVEPLLRQQLRQRWTWESAADSVLAACTAAYDRSPALLAVRS